ncbi:4F2 cell-surface antigen heavy chain-like [Polypterus senegalus]
MSSGAEVDMKDVELNELEQDKQLMPSPGEEPSVEKNGCVAVKLPEEVEAKFTGLSKEELMKVAGTPGWVRIRWALLILFWLAWIGMLVGAIVIVVQAPRCKSLPSRQWWQKGAIYQISNEFLDSKEVVESIDYLSQLKVKSLIVGPIPQVYSSGSTIGSNENLTNFQKVAQMKGLKVVLDITPNNDVDDPWINISSIYKQNKFKSNFENWLKDGIDGIMVSEVETIQNNASLLWEELKNLTSQYSTEAKPRILIGVTSSKDLEEIVKAGNQSGVDLLLSGVLHILGKAPTGSEVALNVERYITGLGTAWPLWSVGSRTVGHLASLVEERLVKIYQMMLFTLPGTPFTNYGDEIGLQDLVEKDQNSKLPMMLWDNSNSSVMAQTQDTNSMLNLYKQLSDLKLKDRSLQYGDFYPIVHNASIYAYLREWDQSERFLTVLNFGDLKTKVSLIHNKLPAEASVAISTYSQRNESSVNLADFTLEPNEGLLLRFPYVY